MKDLDKLIKEYLTATKGTVDYKKYAYYAITHHSTVIEGSSLTESQVVNLLEYGKTAASKPFEHHLMVNDHYAALQFVVNRAAKDKSKLSVKLIQEIAALVMKNTGGFVNTAIGSYNISRGEFRLGTVRAGSRIFPNYQKVPDMVSKLVSELNHKMEQKLTLREKCELAFRAHFEFVSIHPFGDGNGRTARLLMNYIQAYFDLPLSIVFKQDRIKYIDALEASRKKDNLEAFNTFMFGQYKKFLKHEIKQNKQ